MRTRPREARRCEESGMGSGMDPEKEARVKQIKNQNKIGKPVGVGGEQKSARSKDVIKLLLNPRYTHI